MEMTLLNALEKLKTNDQAKIPTPENRDYNRDLLSKANLRRLWLPCRLSLSQILER